MRRLLAYPTTCTGDGSDHGRELPIDPSITFALRERMHPPCGFVKMQEFAQPGQKIVGYLPTKSSLNIGGLQLICVLHAKALDALRSAVFPL